MMKRVGEWTTDMKAWWEPAEPGAKRGEPDEACAGTATIKSLHEGRFLQEENNGSMMGQKYTGMRIEGFNNGSKKYEATWTYSMSTGIMSLSGTSKDDGKTIEWTATFDNETGVKETMSVLTKITDDDHFSVKLYVKAEDGKEGPVLETVYTRKK